MASSKPGAESDQEQTITDGEAKFFVGDEDTNGNIEVNNYYF
jgi:hypothetical protein